MEKKIYITFLTIFISLSLFAQPGGGNGPGTSGPGMGGPGGPGMRVQVDPITFNEDGTVTIRYRAPETVKSVKVCGDVVPVTIKEGRGGTQEQFGPQEMTKGENNVWEYTTEVLEPDMYKYYFEVDGVKTIDMNNLYVIRNSRSDNANYFILDRGESDDFITHDVPHGTVSFRWYHSNHFDHEGRMIVYTPAGYEESDERYPVLYIFHGATEDETAWYTQGRFVEIMDNLIAQGRCKPMIVVAPNGDPENPASLELLHYDASLQPYGNDVQNRSRGKENFDYYETERYFPEVIDFIDANYRTVAEKDGRAVCGVSMGGRNAMNVSRINRNTFGYVGLFSPALEPNNHFPEKKWDDEIISSLGQQAKDGVSLYYIAVGQHDIQWQTNVPFREILDEVGMEYVYHPTGGGHNYNNWRKYLIDFSSRLFK